MNKPPLVSAVVVDEAVSLLASDPAHDRVVGTATCYAAATVGAHEERMKCVCKKWYLQSPRHRNPAKLLGFEEVALNSCQHV